MSLYCRGPAPSLTNEDCFSLQQETDCQEKTQKILGEEVQKTEKKKKEPVKVSKVKNETSIGRKRMEEKKPGK